MDFETAKRAIARVTATRQGAKRTGTAFYIGGKFVVTCLHVIADKQTNPPTFFEVGLEFFLADAQIHQTTAKIFQDLWDSKDDWAVLECVTPPDVAPIDCTVVIPKKDEPWETYGYPEINPAGLRTDGTIKDPQANIPIGTSSTKGLQLYSEEGGAGAGARLHGFSGSPCLIEVTTGEPNQEERTTIKAAGILRSTLIEITRATDPGEKDQIHTQAGTAFACPVEAIIEKQRERGFSLLPPHWAPPEIPPNEFVCQDFLVFLSAAEKSNKSKLQSVVKSAHGLIPSIKGKVLDKPAFYSAADVFVSDRKLREAVSALCKASVVVFDATDFEPAIMLLAGIRAVVKRGVTILSIGGGYTLGDKIEIPFNVMDANIVSHSQMDSSKLLSKRIKRGLDELGSPYYLDLPVFDALRKIPANRRGIVTSADGVLVLCSFDSKYRQEVWEQFLAPALGDQLEQLRLNEPETSKASLGVARSFELNSPRLVSQAIYEYIRSAESCVVDLTNWSANVLFEFGVRLAASKWHTACIINKNWGTSLAKEPWREQCERLLSLFVPEHLQYVPEGNYQDVEAYKKAYGKDATVRTAGPSSSLFAHVERMIELEGEPAALTVYQELINSAELFSRPEAGGKAKPVGLYPGNLELTRREEEAEYERLLAAWYYLTSRYTETQLFATSYLRQATLQVISHVLERHMNKLEGGLKDAMNSMRKRLKVQDNEQL